jgi:UDP-N-acetylmuramoyl-tripeptide--D-alanyl-D-alanine ligase
MGAISAGTFAEMCGGTLRDGRGAELRIRAICTDSGEADGETVFTALRGEREDGHNYIANAIANGCRCILCEHSCDAIEQAGAAAVVVNNTELALSYFANACRHALTCHTVAVTGSVGKTTTKDMIWAVLSEKHKTYRTPTTA